MKTFSNFTSRMLVSKSAIITGTVAALTLVGITSASIIVPIQVTGYNRDVVLAANQTTASGVTLAGFDSSGNALYESGQTRDVVGGLPTSGLITSSVAGVNTSFQLQAYGQNDAVQINSPGNQSVLHLAVPSAMTQLAILAGTGEFFGGSVGSLKLTFTNGMSVTTDYYAGPSYMAAASSGTTPGGNSWAIAINSMGYYSTINSSFTNISVGPNLYETKVNLENVGGTNYSTYQLASLTFGDVANPSSGSVTNIMAVSGSSSAFTTVSAPEPTTLGLLALGSLVVCMRRRLQPAMV